MDGLPLFAAVIAAYGALILVITALHTGRRLFVALLVAQVPPLLLFSFSHGGSSVRELAIPMTTGVMSASVIRRLKGSDIPLRGTPPASPDA